MHRPEVSLRAKQLGVSSVPAVVVDGKLADCCKDMGPTEASLKQAGIRE